MAARELNCVVVTNTLFLSLAVYPDPSFLRLVVYNEIPLC